MRCLLDAQDKFVELSRAQITIPMVGIRWNLCPMSCLPLSSSSLLIVAFCPLVFSVGFPLPGLFLSSHSYSWGNAYFENVLQTQAPLRPHFHSLASGSDNLCYCTDVKPLNELPFIPSVRRFLVGGAWVPAVVMVMMGWGVCVRFQYLLSHLLPKTLTSLAP